MGDGMLRRCYGSVSLSRELVITQRSVAASVVVVLLLLLLVALLRETLLVMRPTEYSHIAAHVIAAITTYVCHHFPCRTTHAHQY